MVIVKLSVVQLQASPFPNSRAAAVGDVIGPPRPHFAQTGDFIDFISSSFPRITTDIVPECQMPPPVTQNLAFKPSLVVAQAIRNVMKTRPASDYQPRAHIASSILCQDILSRLAPSFKKHSPCDIIDVFPGAGLLSRQLHDHIKPRRHLLIEPNLNYYNSFLQPLTTVPDSRYKHLAWDPFDLKTYDDIFDEGHLPEQSERPLVWSNGSRCTTNDTLLVVANFTASPQLGNTYTLMLRYLEACFDQTLFHKYGLVRVIGFLTGADAEVLLPRVTARRRRSAALAEAACAEITEVAGDNNREYWHSQKGVMTWDVSLKQVQELAEKAGVVTPEDREAPRPPCAPNPSDYGKRVRYIVRPKRSWHETYIKMTEDPDRPNLKAAAKRGRPSSDTPKRPLNPHHARAIALHNRLAYENKDEKVYREAEPINLKIELLEAELASKLRTEEVTLDYVLKRAKMIRDLKNEATLLLAARNSAAIMRFNSLMEERSYFDGVISGDGKPLLVWDKRPYEPLRVDTEEFWPQQKYSIIDFQPNPNSPIIQTQKEHIENKTLHTYNLMLRAYRHLLGTVTTHSQKSVGEILPLMFPGRSMKDIMESIPGLIPYARQPVVQLTDSKYAMKHLLSTAGHADGAKPFKEVHPELATYNEKCFDLVKCRHLPSSILWDIIVEWQKSASAFQSEADIHRALGGGRIRRMEGEQFSTGFV
ncbi:hypothetical protein AJ79_04720 [Helicocarpus griseus UAMH5409]|uniref:rRNA adenine N(6)-methyltransferase n=1 Tax=Helicocarpus griseus UAMH5409 TaxID=1447875 RepID=A0A2B7XT81_9EURO|nr:hypothetical protein AJ79_04720 [Helicocarpus griseus UAMH5409]